LPGFTGTAGNYQPPDTAELTIDTSTRAIIDSVNEIELKLIASGIVFDEAADPAALI